MADMAFHSQVRTQLTLSTLTKHWQKLEIVLKFVILNFLESSYTKNQTTIGFRPSVLPHPNGDSEI